ncbi:MAG: hypothetical protein HZA72_03740, partial [Candidatus Omnitrophica bacterium]|nr:hypothetical protein [Candidatus Omnitrophota bacterium]
SSGYIDTSILKTFPDENIKKETAKYLMEQGRMSAGEFFSITSSKPIALYGIEDNPLYKENLEQFRRIYEINEATRKDVAGLIAALKGLQDKIYSRELKELEANSVLHKEGSIGFSERWGLVNSLGTKFGVKYQQYENLTKLVESLKLEKNIDFQKANKERDALIDILSKKMTKPDLEQLVLKSLSFKMGKIAQGEYYIFLQELARRYGIEPEPYKDLITYTEYITLYESIDLLEIFEEVRKFEDAIKERLFTSDEQRKLHDYSRCVSFIKDLFEIKLTNGDVEYLAERIGLKGLSPKGTVPNVSAETLAAFFKDTSLKYNIVLDGDYDLGRIFENIPTALKFYRTAEERNSAIFSNTIKRMNEEGQNVAALITGGYHTKGLTEILRQKETSYLVILPKFDVSKGERPYVAILTNKKEPYEGLLKSGQYYLATTAYFAADSAMPEAVRFAAYRNEFLSILKDKVKDVKNPVRAYGMIQDTVGTWRANYESWYKDFKAPEGFIPKTPEEMDALFFSPLLEKLKPAQGPKEKSKEAGYKELTGKIETLQQEVMAQRVLDEVVKGIRTLDESLEVNSKRLDISDSQAIEKIREAVLKELEARLEIAKRTPPSSPEQKIEPRVTTPEVPEPPKTEPFTGSAGSVELRSIEIAGGIGFTLLAEAGYLPLWLGTLGVIIAGAIFLYRFRGAISDLFKKPTAPTIKEEEVSAEREHEGLLPALSKEEALKLNIK